MEQTPERSRTTHAVPRIAAHTIVRPRLFDRLTSWTDVTVVHGPIGAGKSTLLAAWARTLRSEILWCEPHDGTLTFSQMERFALAAGGVLVIDRGERIDGAQFEMLGRLIDRFATLRVVIATRSAQTALEVAASCDADVDVITPVDLLFTLDDLAEADVLDGEEARREVIRRSEGLAIAVRAKTDEALGRISGARSRLRRTLRADLDRHDGRYDSAVRLALLPRVDRPIVESWGLSARLLDDLDATGFASWDGEWFHMHPFIRSVLLEDATRHILPEERRNLIVRAVRSSLIDHDPLQALREALDLDDPALATEVVFANMVDLLEMRDATYEVFQGTPTSRLRGYPGLTVMLTLLSNMDPGTRPRALQLLATESLFQRLQPHRGVHRERVVYRAFEAAALRLTPFSSRALPLVRKAVKDFEALTEDDAQALGRMGPMLQTHLGIAAFYLRDLDLARRCFDLAYARHVEAGRADRVDPLSLRGGLAALTGDMDLARRLLAEADAAVWPTGWRESSPADFFHLGRAVLALEDGDPEAAQRHLSAAGPIVDLVEHWTLFALVRARRDRLADEVQAGLMRVQRLREERGSAPGTALSRSFLDAAEAELHLAAGEAVAARRVAGRSAKQGAPARIALARAELALGNAPTAAVHAQRLLKSTLTPRNRLEAELVLVCCALRQGHTEDAEVIAKRVFELARSTGASAPLRTVPPSERDALAAALRRAGAPDSTIALIAVEVSATSATSAPLTPRERAVLEELSSTGSLNEIASQLFVSRNTVKSQLRAVYRKLGVSSRDAALARAALLGLFEQSD
ncbi:helix-turn-helix transcriptional regulator [Microbacterium alcoholitolerans]|uniref:helix-turn-helix transcriptional regulator n=1 Tax=unclassified Microbacterium TaxID=2609290 RepID=UPI003D16EA19